MHCAHPHHRHSLFCILPPYMLDQIARNGTPAQRDAALRTRGVTGTLRTLRLTNQGLRALQRPGVAPLAAAAFDKRRSVFTAGGDETLPGTLARAEGDPASGDVAVDEAYDGLGATFDFWAQVYSRNSIDDSGLPLRATVHFGTDYNNAFWNSEQMVFGDGDGQIFNRFTISLDVIGHELAHGVTEDEAQLQYLKQSGALNESMSDVFGSLIKQYTLKQTATQADWLIGAGLLTSRIRGVALRSMKAPGTAYDDPVLGKDPQPGHLKDYVQTMQDSGGVHINSGIPNRAFVELAVALGGFAWEKAGRIWYETLRDANLRPNANFQRFATLTVNVAGRLYAVGSAEQLAVRQAWAGVGITA